MLLQKFAVARTSYKKFIQQLLLFDKSTYFHCIGPLVHKINLCQDTKCSLPCKDYNEYKTQGDSITRLVSLVANEWFAKQLPDGSTSREILIASEVARSWFAGEIAKIMQLGCKEI